jgi:hypothetical protein
VAQLVETLRRCAGSIPDGVIGIFHLGNPSGRTIGLGSTQNFFYLFDQQCIP